MGPPDEKPHMNNGAIVLTNVVSTNHKHNTYVYLRESITFLVQLLGPVYIEAGDPR